MCEYTPPKWVYKYVEDIKDSLLKDAAYCIYSCGCIRLYKEDKKIRRVNPFRLNKKTGKHERHFLCNCEKGGLFECKVKICSECETIYLSKHQRDGICRTCKSGRRLKNKERVFYQNGQLFFDIPKNPTFTQYNCKHRGECLKKIAPIPEREVTIYLWCYGCPKYKKEHDLND